MEALESLLYLIGFFFAPVHELGHVIFGWLSFNPTVILGWALARSYRDGFMVAFGGVFTELVFFAGMSEWLGRKSLAIYPWCLSLAAIVMMSIPFQTDQYGYEPLMPILWYITGVLCLLFMLVRLAQRSRLAARHLRYLNARPVPDSPTMPKNPKAYLDWLNQA